MCRKKCCNSWHGTVYRKGIAFTKKRWWTSNKNIYKMNVDVKDQWWKKYITKQGKDEIKQGRIWVKSTGNYQSLIPILSNSLLWQCRNVISSFPAYFSLIFFLALSHPCLVSLLFPPLIPTSTRAVKCIVCNTLILTALVVQIPYTPESHGTSNTCIFSIFVPKCYISGSTIVLSM